MIKQISTLVLLLCLLTSSLYGQQRQDQRRNTAYQALLMRTDRPHSYFDHVSFPVSDSTSQFAFLFRIDYDSVPFMKAGINTEKPTSDAEYYADIQIGLEIFEGPASKSRNSSQIPISVLRDNWQDTLWVDSYEKTQSRTDYFQGMMSTPLSTGQYHYELQIPRPELPVAQGNRSSRQDRPNPRRNLTVNGVDGTEDPDFILLKSFQSGQSSFSATFLNYGDNILYGEDYSVLIQIPSDAEPNQLSLNLYRLTGGANADSEELRHSVEISSENIIQLNNVNFRNENGEIGFRAEISGEGSSYAYVQIPNRDFENSIYKLALENNNSDEVIGEKRIRSQWLDMPVSLYNLDVAIDMLRFIVNDEQLRELNSGSNSARERKFREFWAQRDPTPDTEFNELMTEYYNRIDHAYEEFSSLQVPGYNTDQGRAYILYGPPDQVDRRMPTNAPTREIWEYPDKTLIFEATTGFGDFKLISEQQS
ncbi:GWxTD domain-containing protein [Rhodohalobacter sulfatireducens]|uniref:GWxTD domain-containing protein n=1 Tax=Rhodohalobacter sulfatireducens TaxID=2911366 RepID=A0ABS9KB87_9BACT|nr:GWxTD domain-containing protein [Rhodohalobacter sulfatireducens]MCG2588096.1 GWxTD domain-containing protein [Rhodohalobacter sulfatireducens]